MNDTLYVASTQTKSKVIRKTEVGEVEVMTTYSCIFALAVDRTLGSMTDILSTDSNNRGCLGF